MVNVVFFKRYEYGGHFPAVSHPEQYASDIKEFFQTIQTKPEA